MVVPLPGCRSSKPSRSVGCGLTATPSGTAPTPDPVGWCTPGRGLQRLVATVRQCLLYVHARPALIRGLHTVVRLVDEVVEDAISGRSAGVGFADIYHYPDRHSMFHTNFKAIYMSGIAAEGTEERLSTATRHEAIHCAS